MNKIKISVKRKQRTGDIYLIRCKEEPLYVGKSIQMKHRWQEHLSDTRSPIKKHMVKFGLQLDDYNLEILETMQVVDQYDKKLCAAEATHFHCFTEQGYQLINEKTPNNGIYSDHNSITYSNMLAWKRKKISCELCGAMNTHGGISDHQKTKKCLNNRMADDA